MHRSVYYRRQRTNIRVYARRRYRNSGICNKNGHIGLVEIPKMRRKRWIRKLFLPRPVSLFRKRQRMQIKLGRMGDKICG